MFRLSAWLKHNKVYTKISGCQSLPAVTTPSRQLLCLPLRHFHHFAREPISSWPSQPLQTAGYTFSGWRPIWSLYLECHRTQPRASVSLSATSACALAANWHKSQVLNFLNPQHSTVRCRASKPSTNLKHKPCQLLLWLQLFRFQQPLRLPALALGEKPMSCVLLKNHPAFSASSFAACTVSFSTFFLAFKDLQKTMIIWLHTPILLKACGMVPLLLLV